MKILVAGDPRSIHTARFTELLVDLGHEVHLYSVELQYEQEEHLRNLVLHVPIAYLLGRNGVRVEGGHLWTSALCRSRLAKRALSRLLYAQAAPGRVRRAKSLARLADSLSPDLIFSLKMQNEGYTVAAARRDMKRRAHWVHFSWGSDIEFFGKHPDHAPQHVPLLREAYAACDFHIADTLRDLAQGVSLGFHGRTLGAMPAMGGFDLDWLRRLRAQASEPRDTILVKGRHGGYVGRALNVLEAIRRRPQLVRGHRVRIFMATPNVEDQAEVLRVEGGIDCEVLPRIGYKELMRCYGRSVIAVAASEVDGTPGFLLEAMAMGALPVYSDMESVREWVTDGVNARLFPVDDIDSLSAAMADAIENRGLQARAAERNWTLIEERSDRAKLREQLRQWIAQAAGQA